MGLLEQLFLYKPYDPFLYKPYESYECIRVNEVQFQLIINRIGLIEQLILYKPYEPFLYKPY